MVPRSDDQPLPDNPGVRAFSLDNGFTCWVRSHPRPPGAAHLLLHIGVGSLHEEDDERGFAHLLEHLAFRGTRHFPPGAVERFFASVGTSMGFDHNAFTGLAETGYSLALANISEPVLDRALLFLADIAQGMTLLPAEVESVSRVVIEEMLAHHGVRTRVRDAVRTLLLPDSRLAERDPLGTEASLKRVTAEDLERFYRRWYCPGRSTLVAVGDFEPDLLERLVRDHFSDWPRGPSTALPDLGFTPSSATRAAVVADPEVREAQVRLLFLGPSPALRTVGELRTRLAEQMACWTVNRRLSALTHQGRAPFREARLGISRLRDIYATASAHATGPAAEVEPMLACLCVEMERVDRHGILAAELEVARESALVPVRQSLVMEPSKYSDGLLKELYERLSDGRPPISRSQRLVLVEEILPTVSGDEVVAALRARFGPRAELVVAIVPEGPDHLRPDRDRLLAIVRAAASAEVAAPVDRARPRRLLDHRPEPGTVSSQREYLELGLHSLTLGNGVRLHLRPMDYKRQRVYLNIVLAGGRIRESADNIGITTAAALVCARPASATHSSVEVRDWITGKSLNFRNSVDEDALRIAISGDPADLEDGLALVHLLLTRPRLEPSVLDRWQERMEEYREAQGRSLESRLAEASLRLLSGDDPRFAILTAEHTGRITLAAAQEWLERVICPAPMEVAITGDIPLERALELSLAYLGSLPSRPVADPDLDALRQLRPDTGPLAAEVEVPGDEPRAAVLVGWRAAPWSSVRERHMLELAEQVLAGRLQEELRDRRGLTYGADCSFNPSPGYPEASLLAAALSIGAARAEEALGAAAGLVETLAEEGPTAAELETARMQRCELVRRHQRDPKYWSRDLSELCYRGIELEQLKRPERFYQEATVEQVRDCLRRYVVDARRLQVICLPKAGGSSSLGT